MTRWAAALKALQDEMAGVGQGLDEHTLQPNTHPPNNVTDLCALISLNPTVEH
jgi:hypothetical protein